VRPAALDGADEDVERDARSAAEEDVQMRMQTTVTGTRKRANRDGFV
jgi:hypothetical protein